jgi:hypothetical protein
MRFAAMLAILAPAACARLSTDGTLYKPDASTDDSRAATPDAAADTSTTPPRDAPADLPPPADTAAPADTMPECTPQAIGCATDNQVRTCSAQGKWMVGQTCGTGTVCSAGLCLCSMGSCDEGVIHSVAQSQPAGHDLSPGRQGLFLAINGLQPSIRRITFGSPVTDSPVDSNQELSVYALDSNATGNLIWCRQTGGNMPTDGELRQEGSTGPLDPVPCSHVRQVGSIIYYKTATGLNRRPIGGSSAEPVTGEPMTRFDVAGDFLYFVGESDPGGSGPSFLKRLSLSNATRVDPIATRDGGFLGLLVDGSHVFAWTETEILRVPRAGDPQPEMLHREPVAGHDIWAVAQTDSHIYWSTSISEPGNKGACAEARVSRLPKSGAAPAVVISQAPRRCAGDLVVVGDRVYAATWSPSLSTIIDLRRIRL